MGLPIEEFEITRSHRPGGYILHVRLGLFVFHRGPMSKSEADVVYEKTVEFVTRMGMIEEENH